MIKNPLTREIFLRKFSHVKRVFKSSKGEATILNDCMALGENASLFNYNNMLSLVLLIM